MCSSCIVHIFLTSKPLWHLSSFFLLLYLLACLLAYLQCDTYITYITYINHDIHGSTPNTLFTLRYTLWCLTLLFKKKYLQIFFLFCLNIIYFFFLKKSFNLLILLLYLNRLSSLSRVAQKTFPLCLQAALFLFLIPCSLSTSHSSFHHGSSLFDSNLYILHIIPCRFCCEIMLIQEGVFVCRL